MAEEKKGKKWEGAGEPPGKGGTAKQEKTEGEVSGRAYPEPVRGVCGHLLWVDSDWSWAICPLDGVITYAWR
jgi:hypothetical protein